MSGHATGHTRSVALPPTAWRSAMKPAPNLPRSLTPILCSQHFLEDVDAIVANYGCTAIVCLPLLLAEGQAGSSSSPEERSCLGALTLGFSSDDQITSA